MLLEMLIEELIWVKILKNFKVPPTSGAQTNNLKLDKFGLYIFLKRNLINFTIGSYFIFKLENSLFAF